MVVSAADHWTLNDGTTHPTGFWAEELVEPHRLFTDAGWTVDFATPGGAAPTVDQNSLKALNAGGPGRVRELNEQLKVLEPRLNHPLTLADVNSDDYDVVFYPGGHGPMEDLAVDATSGAILTKALLSGKPLGVLCHAPAAMLAATNDDGSWPFAGYKMTGFSNAEEKLGGLAAKAPWLVEDRLVELGAKFAKGVLPFTAHLEIDRNLFTGQNPASSTKLAGAILDALESKTS
jgi:aldehyde dehydrogenase (NAD+)